MTIASIVLDLIKAENTLTTAIPEEKWFAASSIDEANRPDPLFAVLRYGTTIPGMAHIKRGTLEIWVHDLPGSYKRINDVIANLYGTLNGVVHQQDSDGNELLSADWVSDSGDLFDPGYRTIVRTTSYNLIRKGV